MLKISENKFVSRPDSGMQRNLVHKSHFPRSLLMALLTLLPNELAVKILSFLKNRKELLKCTVVCQSWYKLANTDTLWKALCLQDWQGKQFTTMDLAHRMDYHLLADELTTSEMKTILKQRKVKPVGLFEKSEWIQCIKSTTPQKSPKGPWTGKWKASYIAKLLDSRRTAITKDELCSIDW